ncbi:carbon-nitrogen family hydrolase [Desulfovibrionales bacterium]
MRVGLVQCNAIPGDASGNLDRIAGFVARAADAGCNVVLFPELADLGYDMSCIAAAGHAAWPHTQDTLALLAARHALCLVCGVCLAESTGLANALVAWGPDGNILATYRKMHLFCTQTVDEAAVFQPGHETAMFSYAGISFGLALCYDLRFPELFRIYAYKDCEAMLVAAAWPAARIHVWQTLVQARAIENQYFVLGANRTGTVPFVFGGASLYSGPDGTTQHASSKTEKLVLAHLDIQQIALHRAAIPSLAHCRPELYKHACMGNQTQRFDEIRKRG